MGKFTSDCLLLFFAGAVLLSYAAGDIASDRAALLALRSAAGGRSLLWNISADTCSWPGVTCSPDGGAVVELHFPAKGLSGRLPANAFSNMTNLQTLSIRYNSLTGPIPADMFTSLSNLRNLYLQHNFFNGGIPDSIFALNSLVRLNLADNNFSGPIPAGFSNLTRLGTLFLQNNQFSGEIPDLKQFSLLDQFDVSNNNLTGEIPKSLSKKAKSSFLGNSLCGEPLDPCAGGGGSSKSKKHLSGGAIAGIVIGAALGFLLLLLLLICLCRKGGAKSKDNEREIEVPIPPPKSAEAENPTPAASAAVPAAKVKGKGLDMGGGDGKKGLVFVGANTGWNFGLEDLLRASAEVLGKGTMGTAYKAVLDSGLAVVVKRLRDINLGEKDFRDRMEEIGRMDHDNLVHLRAYHFHQDEKLLVFDYLPMGSLSALLHGNKGAGRTPLNWDTRAAIALGAAKGIAYIHARGPTISHGNIKSSNILLTKSYAPRVSDYGLAQLTATSTPAARVAGYRAPEVTDPRKISHKADVYSFGVLLLELLTGKAPTHSLLNDEGVDLPRWVQSVVQEEWTAEVFDLELLRYQNVEEDMVQLLQLAVDCTAQYPDKRPGMDEVVTKIDGICRRQTENSDDITNVGEEEEQGK
ncbi:probable inactive receptor kinase At1g48480 [Andrographis paniculata]|uniref:probable inactive receptor kinase At1g48480 n=1 Tax=Andrographis paniculata TaxID=175694 RepID=UPI0021E946E7|nr:probable inactive receptor kinase At1g48480 [Andrographis paniculata]